MDPVAFSAALLRTALPDLVLRPGATVAARVLEREGPRGLIVLAGATVEAELPAEVKAGDQLRLVVAEVTPERVVLRQAPEQAPVPVAVPIPLPDGRSAHIAVDESDPGGGRDRSGPAVELRYESPALGSLGLRLELVAGRVLATVRVTGEEALGLARDGADALRAGLAEATGREASVSVVAWRGRFDSYA